MTPEQLAEYNRLIAASFSPRAIQAEGMGFGSPEYQRFVFLRGLNAGLEQAVTMLHKAMGEPLPLPDRVTGHLPQHVTYKSEFGPHRLTKVNDDGEWFYSTEEDRHV